VFNALIDFTGAFEYRVTTPPCAAAIATVIVSLSSAIPPCGNLDCLGVPNGTAEPGTPCNDNNAQTTNDTWTANCDCVGTPIGIDEPEAAAGMILRPNPATESLTIETPGGMMTGYDITTIDGRTVRSTDVTGTRTVVQREDLASGNYRITVRFADGRATRSIVFE
jgi:hypothetical protein